MMPPRSPLAERQAKRCCLRLLLAVSVIASDSSIAQDQREAETSSSNSFLGATYHPPRAARQVGHSSHVYQQKVSSTKTNAIHAWRKRISSLLDTTNGSPLLSMVQQPANDKVSYEDKPGPYPLSSMSEEEAVVSGKHKASWKKVGDAEDFQVLFDSLDQDHDHSLSIAEFSTMVKPLLVVSGNPAAQFEAWDEDHDGHLDFSEFNDALHDAKVGHEYGDVFRSLTMHGPIDRTRLLMLLNHELHGRADMTENQLDTIVRENGGLPKAHPVITSLAQLTPIMDSIVAFKLVDRDDNGYLSGPELSSFLQIMSPGTSDGYDDDNSDDATSGTILLQTDDGPSDVDGHGQMGFFDFFKLTHSIIRM